MERKNLDFKASYPAYPKLMSVACIDKGRTTLILLFLNTSVDLERDIVYSNISQQ